MKLKPSTIDELAMMVCGGQPYTAFPYRTSSQLTSFFRGIDQEFKHDGSSRRQWVASVLDKLNSGQSADADFPSEEIIRTIEFLLDPIHFNSESSEQSKAISIINSILKSDGFYVEKDGKSGKVNLIKSSDGFVSTARDSMRHKRIITFSPSVFSIPNEPVDDKLVSVMMPYEMSFDGVLGAIRQSCTNVGMDCRRADDIWDDSVIIQDVFKLIFCSSIVVVDFSGKNSNVFYEAGIAHTLGKNVIPITQSLNDIPFDLRHHRALLYLNNEQGLGDLIRQLESRLETLIGSGVL
jgi:hypothetical protein